MNHQDKAELIEMINQSPSIKLLLEKADTNTRLLDRNYKYIQENMREIRKNREGIQKNRDQVNNIQRISSLDIKN
jgi:5-bromo-4-chloroindolyl phosphate hydrolysis protein